MKRVHLPAHMQTAGRVDFVLKKVPKEANVENFNILYMGNYDRFDPYNRVERNKESRLREEASLRSSNEKPWWWSYFTQFNNPTPHWLLKN